MSSYPTIDTIRSLQDSMGARIVAVEPFSVADDAGFEPGCVITTVNGHTLRDIIDWRWYSADEVLSIGYIDLDGDAGVIELERDENQPWGFCFEGVIFDQVQRCKNACTFCFMSQLPSGMRDSLYLRDDDYRLSFLCGTFVTLTNLTSDDEQRIKDMHLSPLRMSLHAHDEQVRNSLIGAHAPRGLAALSRLLAAGIEFHIQIVLVPGVNDGKVLDQTLGWCSEQKGILDVCIVPLGYTAYQSRFDKSFNTPLDAASVLSQLEPHQAYAMEHRGYPWVYAADEFYLNAYGDCMFEHLPTAEFYGDFAMYEDGVGMVRSFVDDWGASQTQKRARACQNALVASKMQLYLIAGEAIAPYFEMLLKQDNLDTTMSVLPVCNSYFGGNVDVTGLLCACDIISAIQAQIKTLSPPDIRTQLFAVPSIIFNDEGLTLDGSKLHDIEKATGVQIAVVSCNASSFFSELTNIIATQE